MKPKLLIPTVLAAIAIVALLSRIAPVHAQANNTVTAGQQAVTGTAAALPSNAAHNGCVQALGANTINVYVGPSTVTTANGFPLAPGQTVCEPVNNIGTLYVIASTTGASVAWIAVY
jgi:hypothetical protein